MDQNNVWSCFTQVDEKGQMKWPPGFDTDLTLLHMKKIYIRVINKKQLINVCETIFSGLRLPQVGSTKKFILLWILFLSNMNSLDKIDSLKTIIVQSY